MFLKLCVSCMALLKNDACLQTSWSIGEQEAQSTWSVQGSVLHNNVWVAAESLEIPTEDLVGDHLFWSAYTGWIPL